MYFTFEFSNSALFLCVHICNNHKKPIRASRNKAFNLELKFPYIFNVFLPFISKIQKSRYGTFYYRIRTKFSMFIYIL